LAETGGQDKQLAILEHKQEGLVSRREKDGRFVAAHVRAAAVLAQDQEGHVLFVMEFTATTST
jgi:hypothetical protein